MIAIEQLGVVGYGEVGKTFAAGLRPRVQGLYVADLKLQNPAHAAAETDYGGRFACAIARDNIFATQFHPEKCAAQGLALFRNFLHWQP